MSRFNAVPVIVQQAVEDLRDPTTSEQVKFNRAQSLRDIRDFIVIALKDYDDPKKAAKR